MGSPSASGGGAGGNTGADAGFFVSEQKKKQKKNEENLGTSDYQGDIYNIKQPKKKNILERVVEASPTVRVVKALLKPGEEFNREYFETTVKPAGTSKYSNYEDYMKARTKGEVDAYGREITSTGRDGGNGGGAIGTSGQVVQAPQPVTSPTTAEVSQSTAAQAEDPILLRRRRTLARGRSPTIMTGVTGVTGGLTLGKPSLLGR